MRQTITSIQYNAQNTIEVALINEVLVKLLPGSPEEPQLEDVANDLHGHFRNVFVTIRRHASQKCVVRFCFEDVVWCRGFVVSGARIMWV